MTQGLMDLKRLYWNTRRFRTGRRKGSSPYELLGLKLSMSWWDLLKLTRAVAAKTVRAKTCGVRKSRHGKKGGVCEFGRVATSQF